jgi:hypothetical protein
MSAANPSRIGAKNAVTGTRAEDRAIFLEEFSGLVLARYDFTQLTDDRQVVRNIASGKSAQFPMVWSTVAASHVPGAEIVGQEIEHNAKSIVIEDLLYSDAFVDVLDDAMNHYEVKSQYAHQIGEALANARDKNSFRGVFTGAAASHLIDQSGDNDGTAIQSAGLSTTASVAKAAIYDAAETLDEKNIPTSERYAALLPLTWYLLLEDGEFIHRDYAGEGSKAHALMPFAADLQVLKSNNIPTANDTENTDVPSVLRDDFRECVGLVWHKSAIATVKLLDLRTEIEWDTRRQGTLLIGSYAIGQDFIRPEACVSIEDTSIV